MPGNLQDPSGRPLPDPAADFGTGGSRNATPPASEKPALAHPPLNVSFAKDSAESTAYREHNPPAVLRRQEAARREMSPVVESHPASVQATGSQMSPVASSNSLHTANVGANAAPSTATSTQNAGLPPYSHFPAVNSSLNAANLSQHAANSSANSSQHVVTSSLNANSPLHPVNPSLHAGNPPLHAGNPPLHAINTSIMSTPSRSEQAGRSGTPTSIISPYSSPQFAHVSYPVSHAAGSRVSPESSTTHLPPSIMQNRGRGSSQSSLHRAPFSAGEIAGPTQQELGLTEHRLTEHKLADQKLADQKLADQKLSDSKLTDKKLSDPKLSDRKPSDHKLADHKLADHKLDHKPDHKSEEVHILVAVTGSVATIKLPQIVHKLKQIYRKRAIIQVVVTKASTIFFDRQDLPKDVKIWYDSDEWRSREEAVSSHPAGSGVALPGTNTSPITVSDQQLHIQLRRWADILLVAPCSANTLAKLTYGICDNLLTSIFRVWNQDVPILLAPAMNTHMYTNPVTKRHFNVIKESFPFVEILRPVEKVLVCGDIGMGGMREWNDIVQILVKRVGVSLESDTEDDESETDE